MEIYVYIYIYIYYVYIYILLVVWVCLSMWHPAISWMLVVLKKWFHVLSQLICFGPILDG